MPVDHLYGGVVEAIGVSVQRETRMQLRGSRLLLWGLSDARGPIVALRTQNGVGEGYVLMECRV